MKISLIGSGNVATLLGRLMLTKGHSIVQVLSRDIHHARILADELNAGCGDMDTQPDDAAEIFVIAIADSGLENFFNGFGLRKKLLLHTAGAVSIDVLRLMSDRYGVLYPLQSLRKEMPVIPAIPFLVDGCTAEVTTTVLEFAKTLSDDVQQAGDEQRLKLHTAAVIVSNFTNHLYALAENFCQKELVDFNLLKPLIKETAGRIQYASPAAMQTGPAIRKDIVTMDKHLRLLAAHPKLRTTYLRLTDSIMNP